MTPGFLRALEDIGSLLDDAGIPFAVIGGLAVGVHGEPRHTADIDLVLAADVEGGLNLLASLSGTGFVPLFAGAEEVVRRAFILPLRHAETGLTLDLAIGLTGFEREAIRRARPTIVAGLAAPVVTAEDLLLMKVIAGRPRDQEDAAGIVRRQGGALDWGRLLLDGRRLEQALGQEVVAPLQRLRTQVPPEPP